MEKDQITLYDYFLKKSKKHNGSPIFYYGKNSIDKKFCMLYEKFLKAVWEERFNPLIRGNKTNEEVQIICKELREEFLEVLRKTLVYFSNKS